MSIRLKSLNNSGRFDGGLPSTEPFLELSVRP